MTPAQSFIAGLIPRDRDLDRPEMRALAGAIGTTPELWEALVRHDPGMRYYSELYRDMHLDVWLICWLDDQKTGYHDHDRSSGAVYVCQGTLVEDRFAYDEVGLRHATRSHDAGSTFDFDAAYIHGVRHAGGPPATSIHCYSPPLWRMGHYDFDEQGALCRTSATYLEEVAEGDWSGDVVSTPDS